MPLEALEIAIEARDDIVIMRLSGSLDERTASILRPEDLALPPRWAVLILDLTGVAFMNSTGMGAIVHLHKRAREGLRLVILTNPSRIARTVLELSRLNLVLPIYPSVAEAIKAVKDEKVV